MSISNIIASIDREIAVLRQARELLSGASAKGLGGAQGAATRSSRPQKRRLSAEGRRRISEAVKKRWEAQRKAAAKKEAGAK